jgi:GntR family transcriptional regulator
MKSMKTTGDFLKSVNIDKAGDVPIYIQLYKEILEVIKNGGLKEGDQLPNEFIIGEQFEISRTSVRLAMQKLENDKWITRERGRGTFVRKRPLDSSFMQIVTGAIDELRNIGMQIDVKILRDEVLKAPPEIRDLLRLPYNSKTRMIERLLLNENEPLYVSVAYIPVRAFDDFDSKMLFEKSLTNTIQEQDNLKMVERTTKVYPDIPDERTSRLLRLNKIDKKIIQISEVVTTCIDARQKKHYYYSIAFFNAKAGAFTFHTKFN